MPDDPRPILFFDGVCAFCNTLVDWTYRLDLTGKIMFAPLQGETFAAYFPKESKELPYLVFWDGRRKHVSSSAAIRASMAMGVIYWPSAILLLIPKTWRDAAYDAFSRRRYDWFGKYETCRIPTTKEAARFLP